jgi:hypothetical protein
VTYAAFRAQAASGQDAANFVLRAYSQGMTSTETKTPAPVKPAAWTADGTEVSFADARVKWAEVAYDVLRETAGRFGDYITYSALAEKVQAQSGISTRLLTRNWVGKVLDTVAERCQSEDERQLTSLCVKTADETVGDGYGYVFELAGTPVPEDLQLHAAQARLECYEFYGATMPRGGGRPALTKKVARVRDVAAAKRREEIPPVLCVTCNVQVPKSGRCDECEN